MTPQPGDHVIRRRDGAPAQVLRVEGEHLVVDQDGSERRWGRGSVRVVPRESAPRGVVRASKQDLEVARLVAAGERREAIAFTLGITVGQVGRALNRARAAVQEARQRAAMVR